MSKRTRFAQRDGARVAVRMDERYWHALDELASSTGKRTGEIVWEEKDKLGEGDNLTARLRARAVDYLESARAEERVKGGGVDLKRVADVCPSACILAKDDGEPVHFNRLARQLMARPDLDSDESAPTLNYMRPFPRIRDFAVGRGGAAVENICLSKQGRTAIVRSIICLTSDNDSSLTLIFPLKRPNMPTRAAVKPSVAREPVSAT